MAQPQFRRVPLLSDACHPRLAHVESITSVLSDAADQELPPTPLHGGHPAARGSGPHPCRGYSGPTGARGHAYSRVTGKPFEGSDDLVLADEEEAFGDCSAEVMNQDVSFQFNVDCSVSQTRSLLSGMAAGCASSKLGRLSDGKTSLGSASTALSITSCFSRRSADTRSSGASLDCDVLAVSEHEGSLRRQLRRSSAHSHCSNAVPCLARAEPALPQQQQQSQLQLQLQQVKQRHALGGSLTPAKPPRRILPMVNFGD